MKLDSTNISQVVVVTHREPIVPGEWPRDPNNPSPPPAIARSYRNSLITNETDLFGWTQEWQNCDKRQIGWGLLCWDILTLIVILLKLIPDFSFSKIIVHRNSNILHSLFLFQNYSSLDFKTQYHLPQKKTIPNLFLRFMFLSFDKLLLPQLTQYTFSSRPILAFWLTARGHTHDGLLARWPSADFSS